ncbi:MAG: hypothetical protein RL301_210 [Actinomycetota bacterium]|jgi:NAD+ kinase
MRKLITVVNTYREEAKVAEAKLISLLDGFEKTTDPNEAELIVVLGGDGTILQAAEIARDASLPLLGVNLGRVGFLAEVKKFSIEETAKAILNRSYSIDQRMTLEYKVMRNESEVASGWALNEITIERNGTTMVELFLQIDHRPISSWWCDGLIVATPTGSTAYAFSAGGPIIWPEAEVLVVTPIAAHALFTKPLVISPKSEITIDVESSDALVSADSLRKFPLKERDRVVISKSNTPIKLAHIENVNFSDRLVAKFKLPIEGWRG